MSADAHATQELTLFLLVSQLPASLLACSPISGGNAGNIDVHGSVDRCILINVRVVGIIWTGLGLLITLKCDLVYSRALGNDYYGF